MTTKPQSACKRCGRLSREYDKYGDYYDCINCGWHGDVGVVVDLKPCVGPGRREQRL